MQISSVRHRDWTSFNWRNLTQDTSLCVTQDMKGVSYFKLLERPLTALTNIDGLNQTIQLKGEYRLFTSRGCSEVISLRGNTCSGGFV